MHPHEAAPVSRLRLRQAGGGPCGQGRLAHFPKARDPEARVSAQPPIGVGASLPSMPLPTPGSAPSRDQSGWGALFLWGGGVCLGAGPLRTQLSVVHRSSNPRVLSVMWGGFSRCLGSC